MLAKTAAMKSSSRKRDQRARLELPRYRSLRETVESWWRVMRGNYPRDVDRLCAYLHGATMAVKDIHLEQDLRCLRHRAEARVNELSARQCNVTVAIEETMETSTIRNNEKFVRDELIPALRTKI